MSFPLRYGQDVEHPSVYAEAEMSPGNDQEKKIFLGYNFEGFQKMSKQEPGTSAGTGNVTQILRAWREGDQSALEKLTPIVYQDLRRLARRHLLGERAEHTLQPTAVVNEAYLRLVDYQHVQWQDRAHFFAVSAQLVRRILVDHARRRNLKRGGKVMHVSLECSSQIGLDRSKDLIALDDAMNELARMDPRKAKVVELRYFGGLSVEESAEALGISAPTVIRDWSSAKAWLRRELKGTAKSEP